MQTNECKEILNHLIGVYDSIEQIHWNALPNKFVMKCNHGCGYNILCSDKVHADKNNILQQLDKWMHEDYYLENAEVNYKYIKKKIVCETYLDTQDGCLPNDYKIYCFHGEPKLVLVCYERDIELKLVFLDLDWKPTKIGKDGIDNDVTINKPKLFEKMLEYCRKLSRGFPFVRIDFYEVNGKVVFGEMTFTPAGGLAKYYSEFGLKYLGELICLPLER